MKRFGFKLSAVLLVLSATLLVAPALAAHGNNDHVRGVVTQISAESVTVQLQDQSTATLALNAQTTYEKSGKPVQMSELKVGDRVVIDVPKGSKEARLIKFGAPPPKTGAPAAKK